MRCAVHFAFTNLLRDKILSTLQTWTHVKANHNLGSRQLSAPVPPPSRGLQDVVETHFTMRSNTSLVISLRRLMESTQGLCNLAPAETRGPSASPSQQCRVLRPSIYRSRVRHYSIHVRRSSDCAAVVCRKHASVYFLTGAKAMARGRATNYSWWLHSTRTNCCQIIISRVHDAGAEHGAAGETVASPSWAPSMTSVKMLILI